MDDSKKYKCEVCKFTTKTNYCLEVHLLTKKHIRNMQPVSENETKRFNCDVCDKSYKYASGLSAHSKMCKKKNNDAAVSHAELLSPNVVNDLINEMKKINERLDKPTINTTINNSNTTNNFNITVFLNETCKDAINLESFIKNIIFELADPKLMINNYVDGTCNILKRNLDGMPLHKRPLHYLEGEDPNQQLMHIRQDDKWNIGTYVNWLEQIHADDDDDVVDKNPIYYALKNIDDEKLKYLGYNFNDDNDYKNQHGRLNRETSRADLKNEVYKKLIIMTKLNTDKLLVSS